MDIMNIQALIAQGFITDVASIDPNKAYIAVGVFQPGNRPGGSSNANTYPSYAIPVAEFLATGGIYTASNGIALVGNDFQLASLLISQFTNDSAYITTAALAGYVQGVGTIGYVPRWDLTDTLGNSIIFDDGLGRVGINTITPGATLDVQGDAVNPLFKLNNANFLFADKLRVNNNGDFYSGSINAFGGFGQADFTTDHLNYRFNTSYQTYLAFTNAQGAGNKGGYGIIGSSIVNADSDYRLVVLNNDAGTLGSVLKIVSTAINNANDGFDYTNYGVNILSNGIFTNTGAGTFYKVGISLDITNGDVNRAVNIENGVIRVVKANQPLYATLTSGDFYYDTAANILANGDFVVGMKA